MRPPGMFKARDGCSARYAGGGRISRIVSVFPHFPSFFNIGFTEIIKRFTKRFTIW